MKLIKATKEFTLNGTSYEDFPLIVDSKMEIVSEALNFLIYECLTRGRVQSKKTWWRYGQDIYDYFGFLEARDLDWKEGLANSYHSVIAAYRDWSVEIGLSNSTVNGRLRTIIRFYHFAQRKGWINEVPFDIETIIISKSKGFLAHTDTSGNLKRTPNVMLKEQSPQLTILSKQEINTLLSHKSFISQHLIFRMALQTGLRKVELFSFPSKYIEDPINKRGRSIVSVVLDSRDMTVVDGGGTKGKRERTIHIPIGLYERLWQYMNHDRSELLKNNGQEDSGALFLNRFGKPYSLTGSMLNNELKKITERKDISLHKLRHTYATHTLYALRKNQNYHGDALVYVQDRLGHSSIATTQKYLHYLEDLEGELMTEFNEEIDQISMGNGNDA